MSKTEGASLAISLCNERSDKATVRISDSRYFVATSKENVVNFDHDFDHFQNKVSNALLSQKGRLGRPKIGNGLYWDTKSSVNPLPESWGSRGREFDATRPLGPKPSDEKLVAFLYYRRFWVFLGRYGETFVSCHPFILSARVE